MPDVTWQQWSDGEDLFIVGHHHGRHVPVLGIPTAEGPVICARHRNGEWEDITNSVVTPRNQPNEMEYIAMWAMMPEPDEQIRTDHEDP